MRNVEIDGVEHEIEDEVFASLVASGALVCVEGDIHVLNEEHKFTADEVRLLLKV